MRRICLASAMSVTLVVGACGGREAHPVMVQQPNDPTYSCEQLQHEIAMTQSKMNELEPHTSKVGKNVAFGILGLIVWPVWFFMDFRNADKTEFQALEARHNRLTMLSTQKGCAAGAAVQQPQSPYARPYTPYQAPAQPYQAPAQPQPYQPQPYQPQPYQPPQSYDPPAPYQAPAQSGGQGTEQYSF